MIYLLLADLATLLHALFVLFAVAGGLAVLRWPRLAWLHVPAVLWGGAIELLGWICPLTYLENHFRRLGGESGYDWPFITHYLGRFLYPVGLTRPTQILMGVGVLGLNAVLYHRLWRRGVLRRMNTTGGRST